MLAPSTMDSKFWKHTSHDSTMTDALPNNLGYMDTVDRIELGLESDEKGTLLDKFVDLKRSASGNCMWEKMSHAVHILRGEPMYVSEEHSEDEDDEEAELDAMLGPAGSGVATYIGTVQWKSAVGSINEKACCIKCQGRPAVPGECRPFFVVRQRPFSSRHLRTPAPRLGDT